MPPALLRTNSLLRSDGGGARILVGLQRDAERVAEQVEVVDVERAEIDLQRVEDVGQAEAQELRLGAVEIVEELRRRGRERGEQRLRVELGLLARGREQRLRRIVERRAAAARQILDLELEAAGRAEAVDRGRIEAQRKGVGNGEQLWPAPRRPAPRRSPPARARPTASAPRTRPPSSTARRWSGN